MTRPAISKFELDAVFRGLRCCYNLLASKHRDFIKIVLAKPIDSNPLGFGQTPTQICSRIEKHSLGSSKEKHF